MQKECENTKEIIKSNSERLIVIETQFNYISKQLDTIVNKIEK